MNKWLLFWLIFVAGWYLIPWWNRVYFLWDDIELLMQLRNPALSNFLSSHQYQFFPVFKLFYWLEVQLFGVNPGAFLTVSVLLHLINIFLSHRLLKSLTGSNFWGLIAAALVSFNKSFFTVIFWPTIQSNLILTTFLLITFNLFFDLKNKFQESTLFLFVVTLILAGLSFGFGVGAGFIFAAAITFWKKSSSRVLTATAGIAAGVIPILGTLLLSTAEIQKDQIFQLSPMRIFNIAYFTLVGASQAVTSRFFLPGFVPNIHSPLNIAVMITLPAVVLIFLATVIINNRKNKPQLAPLFLFSAYTVIPYFIASLARSGPGALGGLAERYIYLPFFSFILALTYALSLRPLPRRVMIGAALIISAGHQIAMHFSVYNLFI